MTTPTLAMESSLAIVAGSDTTSTALSNALFHLLTTPSALAALRTELDGAAGDAAFGDDAPLACGPERHTAHAAAQRRACHRRRPRRARRHDRADPNVVPSAPSASLSCALLTRGAVHRDARHFAPDPHAFWPERWTAAGPKLAEARGAEFRLTKAAWMPFSYGPRRAPFARARADAVAGP
jgi:cytochrome P450